jgi:hypothetical protein
VGYSWPLQPFDRAHPVRAFFNDPRISGATKAFHFGVDISAPNGTPVYAVTGRTVAEATSTPSCDLSLSRVYRTRIAPTAVSPFAKRTRSLSLPVWPRASRAR